MSHSFQNGSGLQSYLIFRDSTDSYSDGTSILSQYISAQSAAGTYGVTNAIVYDKAGNTTLYSAAQLASLGVQISFTIVDRNVASTASITAPVSIAEDGGQPLSLSQIEHGTLSLGGVAGGLAASAEFQAATGGLSNGAFVDYVYAHALGRAPDQGGHDYWTGRLDGGLSRGDLLIGFSESAEHRGATAALVRQGYVDTDDTYQAVALLYDSFAGRLPDVGGLTFWSEQVKSGARTLAQVSGEFAASGEFVSATQGMSNGQLVDFMYQNTLDRAPDGGGRAFWTDQLDHGLTKGSLLLAFSQSPEHYDLFASHIIGGIDVV